MSKSSFQGSQSHNVPNPVKEPRSVQELCEQLHQLVQKPGWNSETAEQFVNLIINPHRQYLLEAKQQDSLVNVIINCPLEYRAMVHLAIVTANYTTQKPLRTLDEIIPRIGAFLSEFLDLEPGIKENLLKPQGDKRVSELVKKKLNFSEPKQKIISNTDNKKEANAKKFDWIRNLISLLICEGEVSAVATRLNIILEAFADSSHYQQLTKAPFNPESDLQYRVKAVAELFKLAKPNATEAERLLLYGSSAQVLAHQQTQKIAELSGNLQKEQELRQQREDYIKQLEKQCQELEQQLITVERILEKRQRELEHEKILYEQLENSSEVKISQQREAALNQVRNRLEHELQKLERCLSGSAESFQENSHIGLRIIKKIKEQLTD